MRTSAPKFNNRILTWCSGVHKSQNASKDSKVERELGHDVSQHF